LPLSSRRLETIGRQNTSQREIKPSYWPTKSALLRKAVNIGEPWLWKQNVNSRKSNKLKKMASDPNAASNEFP
jgi:hypothetical protein